MTASSPQPHGQRYILVARNSSNKSIRRLVLLGSGLFVILFLANLFRQAFRLQRDDGAYYWYHTEGTASQLLQQIGFFGNITCLMMARSDSNRTISSSTIEDFVNQESQPASSKSSSKPTKNKYYYYDEPLVQEDANIFQGVHARAFEPWSHGPIPCFPKFSEQKKTSGLLFLKTLKTGSTTALGVQLRIAKNEPKRRKAKFPTCHGVWTHQHASRGFPHANKTQSFLWTIVRDPTLRLVMSYLFFHYVSRLKLEPYDHVFIDAIRQNRKQWMTNHYMSWLSLHPYNKMGKRNTKNPVQHANSIMNDYNFIAVTERMDESMVALSLILGVPLSDVLYMNGAKGAGGFDDGLHNNKCTWIAPSFISPGMREYIASPEHQELVRYDHAIHQAANRSLDLTIHKLGVDRFAQHLALYQEARRLAQEECLPTTVLPCSAAGKEGRSTSGTTSCMWTYAGCGYKCLNAISARLGIDRILTI